MSNVSFHPSTQLAWGIANGEACMAGRHSIEPVHLLLGVLKAIDPAFASSLHELDVPTDAIDEIKTLSNDALALLERDATWISKTRRALRKAIRLNAVPRDIEMLHRSPASKDLFRKATDLAIQEHSGSLTMLHLLRPLLRSLPSEARPMFGLPEADSPPEDSASLVAQADMRTRPGEPSTKRGEKSLDVLGRDLSALARQGRLQEALGRDGEMKAIARHLQRTIKRNVLLIGEAGVGKTAIVEGVACRFANPDAPEFLRKTRIIQVSLAALVAGTTYRGDMEKRLEMLIREVSDDPDVVLFLDEIHLAIGGGSGSGTMDIANILKPALAGEEFRCIGATTTEEYERFLKNDSAFLRRFQVVRVPEPQEHVATQIAEAWARRIEERQGVVFDAAVPHDAVVLSTRWITNRRLPDKAIDLLENAATYVKVTSLSFNKNIPSKQKSIVSKQDLETVLEEQWGIRVRSDHAIQAQELAARVSKTVLGQETAIREISELLAVRASSQHVHSKPRAIMLFTGPTGTGKTLTAEVLARELFDGQEERLGRFSMGEYKERHELARLIGAPPGFIGHDQPGALFRFAEQWPEGVILLDEIEKAHPEIQDYFLQIFDRGETLDSKGRRHDFRPYVFVLTANLGPSDKKPSIGFRESSDSEKKDATEEQDALRKETHMHFRQEFIARLDRIVSFQPISARTYADAIERWLENFSNKVGKQIRLINLEALASWAEESDCGFRSLNRILELKLAPEEGILRSQGGQGGMRLRWLPMSESFAIQGP